MESELELTAMAMKSSVERYLRSRRLALPFGPISNVIRHHPALKFGGMTVGGMVSLFRDIRADVPCAIQRTFFDSAGRKLDRLMLGRAKGAAIKIDPDDSITDGLTIGEGLENIPQRPCGNSLPRSPPWAGRDREGRSAPKGDEG
jgi:hypothetical protein